ncbi:MAG: hypothetical protein ACYDA4_04090 [Ignavibacteriaceae bacterium]
MNEKKFITEWVTKLSEEGLKEFPGDFLKTDEVKTINLPEKTLVVGQEFFGSFEILTTDGKSVHHAPDYIEAKYFIYANRTKPKEILLPAKKEKILETITLYQEYLDTLIRHIESDYKKSFPNTKNSSYVVNEIFRHLNLVRH